MTPKISKEQFVRCMEGLGIETTDELADLYSKITEDCGFILVSEKELRDKYAEYCETRVHDIAADAKAFLIEEILDAEPDEILGEA